MEIWRCEKCGYALALINGQEYGLMYGKGRAQIGTLPAKLTCPRAECQAENEREGGKEKAPGE